MTDSTETIKARPVLKWAGGKGQLLPELLSRVPETFRTYHEPFVGGGALFFALASRQRLARAVLSDINPNLIDVYAALRADVGAVIDALSAHRHDRAHYYEVRKWLPQTLTLAEKAARILYLNKTCYNGLYRENRQGQFNVPFGRHKNPTLCDEPNLRAAARALQTAEVACRPFHAVQETAQRDDFVYFDPPYHPLSPTSNFTAYAKDGFGEPDQIALRDVFRALTQGGVRAMLSNSDSPWIRALYTGFQVYTVHASRAINSKAAARGKIPELLVCNYTPDGTLIGL